MPNATDATGHDIRSASFNSQGADSTRCGLAGLALFGMISCTHHRRSSSKPMIKDRLFNSKAASSGRLLSRPNQPNEPASPGLHKLGLDGERDGLIYVPKSYRVENPAPLILMLHGAGGDAEGGLNILRSLADSFNTILLAVDSRQQTWDIIMGRRFGGDIAFIDQALALSFSRYAIDPNRVAIAGFSDGASYALSVGITNGDLFTHIIAFSPGFMAPASQEGSPQIFISHGNGDRVLPIDRCSRKIVPVLQQAGYDVHYREFNGPHTVPGAIASSALDWFTQATPSRN